LENIDKTELKPRLKLWLSSECSGDSFGDGKWHLLQTIKKTSSLKLTCDELSISYRKAWGDLKKAEQCLNRTLVIKQRGGSTKGQSQLTDDGIDWIEAYAKFHRHVEKASKTAYKKYLQKFETITK